MNHLSSRHRRLKAGQPRSSSMSVITWRGSSFDINGGYGKIMSFMESYNFDGITVVPFATSGSSGMGDSSKNLQELAKGAKVVEGKRFGSSASADELKSWAQEWI